MLSRLVQSGRLQGCLLSIAFLLGSVGFVGDISIAADGPPTNHPFSLPRESGFVGTNGIEAVQKYNNVGPGGDLSVNIPLFTVPGPIPIPLNLSYQSGIKVDQSASWVGLGWNFGGWSVKRVTIHGADIHGFEYLSKETRLFVNDMYEVTIPGRSIRFMNIGTMGHPHFVPISGTRDSLYAEVAMDTTITNPLPPELPDTVIVPETIFPQREYYGGTDIISDNWYYFKYNYFVLIDENATKYIFRLGLKSSSVGEARLDFISSFPELGDNTLVYYKDYLETSEWVLTEILSRDYVDGGGTPLDPTDDFEPVRGWYVAFKYHDTSTSVPDIDTLFMSDWDCINLDHIASRYDTTEVTYLKSIVTPNVRVNFELTTVDKFRTIRFWRSGDNLSSRKKDYVLSRFTVKGRSPLSSETYYQATFNYEMPGVSPLKTKWHQYFEMEETECDRSDLERHGEPTLRSITIGTDNQYSQSPDPESPEFTVEARERFSNGYKKRYSFSYDTTLDKSSSYMLNKSIYFRSYTNWIYGKDDEVHPALVGGYENPTIDQLKSQLWLDTLSDFVHKAWGDREFFGYNYIYPQAWSLTSMTTPEGLTYAYEYESDEYILDGHHHYGGGCRVKSITTNFDTNTAVPSINRDMAGTETINLKYGVYDPGSQTNDGIGHPTSMPGNYHSFMYALGSRTFDFSAPYLPTEYITFLSDNVSHQIQYPVITWLLPGKGSAEYYYLTSDSTSQDVLLTMLLDQFSGQNSIFSTYYGYFLDNSPIQGLLYRTIFKNQAGHEINFSQQYYRWPSAKANLYQDDSFYPFGERFLRPDGSYADTLGCSYWVVLDSVVERNDGVGTATHYTYEDNFPYRLLTKSVDLNGYQSVTTTSYATCPLSMPDKLAGDCEDFPNAMRRAYFLMAKDFELVEKDSGGVRTNQQFTQFQYRSDFPSQNRRGGDSLFYQSEVRQWIDKNSDHQIDYNNEFISTITEDVDRYGNATQVRRPDGVLTARIYNRFGLEAEFEDVDSRNFGIFTGESVDDGATQPVSWNWFELPLSCGFSGRGGAYDFGGGHYAFSGELVNVPAGDYVADAWLFSSNANSLSFTFIVYSDFGVVDSIQRIAETPFEWQHIACTLHVALGQWIACYAGGAQDEMYIDDVRIRPIDCIVKSWSYDDLGRVIATSDEANIPVRKYYDQYGYACATADLEWNPLSGKETFYKSTEALFPTQSPGKYRRDLPNVEHMFASRGIGFIENFSRQGAVTALSSDPTPHGYEVSGSGGTIDYQERMSFAGEDIDDYRDVKIPLAPFADGFFAFDFSDSSTTGATNQPPDNPLYRTDLWFGFENHSGQGYGLAICRTNNTYEGKFYVFQYNGDYDNPTNILTNKDLYGPWVEINAEGKRRFMVGKIEDNLFFFYNGECVYHVKLAGQMIDDLSFLKFRLKHPGDIEVGQHKLWVDNIAFYSDPEVTSYFVNAFGIVKQTQQFDGTDIIVSGGTNTLDGRSEATFLPIPVLMSDGYGDVDFGVISDSTNPFDYIDSYLISGVMYDWSPGEVLSDQSRLYAYYNSAQTPDCRTPSGYFAPYTQSSYSADPLRRLTATRAEGVFRDKPRTFSYGHSEGILAGLDPVFSGPNNLFSEKVTDEDGYATFTYKDKTGKVVATVQDSSTTGLNIRTLFYRDFNGYVDSIVKPAGDRVVQVHLNNSWLIVNSSADRGNDYYMYDVMGNRRMTLSATGLPTATFRYYKYDTHQRVVEEGVVCDMLAWALAETDPDYPEEEAAGRKTLSKYEYDEGKYGAGQLTKSIHYHNGFPDSASWSSYQYDVYGNEVRADQFVSVIDASLQKTVEATYNKQQQITGTTYPNGKSIVYEYDRSGQVENVTDADGYLKLAYTYWPTGRVKQKRVGTVLPRQTVDYDYNCRGWLTSINSGMVSDQTSGPEDHFALQLQYTQGGYQGDCADECEFPSGYFTGNIASYRLTVSPGSGTTDVTQHYAYDGAGRLVGESYEGLNPLSPLKYTYDDNGNIDALLSETDSVVADYTYYPNSNRLEQISGVYPGASCLQYTPSGALSRYDNKSMNFIYNDREELRQRTAPGLYTTTSIVDYWYNSEGQRIAKKYRYRYRYECDENDPIDPVPIGGTDDISVDGPFLADVDCAATNFRVGNDLLTGPRRYFRLFSPMFVLDVTPTYCYAWANVYTGYYYFGDNILADYSGSQTSTLINNYVYVNGQREASFKTTAADVRYFMSDQLGSVVATVDGTGQLKNWYQYRPYGITLRRTVTDANRFEYTGKELDPELSMELDYFGARYYDPLMRRFLSVDPLANEYPAWSPYAYTLDNPMNFVDPNGQCPALLFLGALAAAFSYVLNDASYVQAPTQEGDYTEMSTGETVVQRMLAAGGAVSFMYGTNKALSGAAVSGASEVSPMKRGLIKESEAIQKEGLTKNTTKISADGKSSVPDHLDAKSVVEIKNSRRVDNTRQIQTQRQYAKDTGRKHIIYTGRNSKVSGAVPELPTRVIRRTYLNPPEE